MAKVGINVGEEFPADEVDQTDRCDENCGGREDWRRRHEEWHTRARAFKEDVRRAARRHFGEHAFTLHNIFVLRLLLVVAAVALIVALLPHMLLLGILLTVVVFFVLLRHRYHHHDHAPRDDGGIHAS